MLPGIDDGPADLAAAVALVAAAAADGTRVIAATPHLRSDHPRVDPRRLAEGVAELEKAIAGAGIAVDIVPGGELDLSWAMQAGEEDLRLTSLAQRGRDLLVECPYGELPPLMEDMLFGLVARGYRVTLAHPERNPTFQRDRRRLAVLIERGALVQVTASALLGDGRTSRSTRMARELVSEGAAHVLASDMHGSAADRSSLSAGVRAAREIAGARADWMVTDAPAAILAGEALPPMPSTRSPRPRRRLWKRAGRI